MRLRANDLFLSRAPAVPQKQLQIFVKRCSNNNLIIQFHMTQNVQINMPEGQDIYLVYVWMM